MKKILKTFLLGLIGIFVFVSSAIFSYNLLQQHNPNIDLTNLLGGLPKAYIIYSGSMEPAIKTGSLILSVPRKNYFKGDIITFKQGRVKGAITHRIEARIFENDDYANPVYLTSGDANEDLDNWQVTNDQIIGKTILTIPYLGRVANFAKTPQGFILFVIVPATIFIYEEVKSVIAEVVHKFSKIQFKKAGLPKAAVFVPIIGAFLVITSFALGFFSDSEISPGNTLGAAANFEEPTPTPTTFPEEVTICHAAGRADEPANFVTLTLPWNAVYGPGGHFNEDGTTQAGHEEDYLGECNTEEMVESTSLEENLSPSPTPTPTTIEDEIPELVN